MASETGENAITTTNEIRPQPAPLTGEQSSERVENVDKAMDMARAQKDSWDSAMLHKRLAQIQRDAGYNDLAETSELKATDLIKKGDEMAEKRGERWEEGRKKKFERLSRLIEEINEIREKVGKEGNTIEINLNDKGILFDSDTAALLNIGRSGLPPLKRVGNKTDFFEEGEIIFPVEDNMVLVEKYRNQEGHRIVSEYKIRIMNWREANYMRNDIYNHITNIETQKTVESGSQ